MLTLVHPACRLSCRMCMCLAGKVTQSASLNFRREVLMDPVIMEWAINSRISLSFRSSVFSPMWIKSILGAVYIVHVVHARLLSDNSDDGNWPDEWICCQLCASFIKTQKHHCNRVTSSTECDNVMLSLCRHTHACYRLNAPCQWMRKYMCEYKETVYK